MTSARYCLWVWILIRRWQYCVCQTWPRLLNLPVLISLPFFLHLPPYQTSAHLWRQVGGGGVQGGRDGGSHGEENEDCHAWLKLGDESRGWFTLLWQNELNPGWAELRCAMPGLFLNFYTPQLWQGDRQWGAEQITSVSQGKKYGVPERKAKISIQASQLFRRVVFGWSAKSRFGSRSGVVSGKNSTAGLFENTGG